RMKSLAITQANLENQRETVKEERRQRYDNQPYGLVFDTLFETAYDNFAYKHSTIGSLDDLNAATVKDVAEFSKTYYAPTNAVLTKVLFETSRWPSRRAQARSNGGVLPCFSSICSSRRVKIRRRSRSWSTRSWNA